MLDIWFFNMYSLLGSESILVIFYVLTHNGLFPVNFCDLFYWEFVHLLLLPVESLWEPIFRVFLQRGFLFGVC